MINYGDYLIPLLIGKINGSNITLDRYAGVAFFIGKDGLIATCKHIIEMKEDNEVLFVKNLNDESFDILQNIKVHPNKDFAIAYLPNIKDYKVFALNNKKYSIGYDIQAFGFTSNRKQDGIVHVDARFRKGYIVRISDLPLNNESNSLMEISFPSEKGFSGTPIISTADYSVVGMLYGNSESSILQHAITEIEDNGEKFSEKITKIVEFGLAHSNQDIKQYLLDLNIQF